MPTIKIPSPLRSYTNGQSEVAVKGITVAGAMEDFISTYPALQPHLFNNKGELRPFVNLFLNSQDVRHLQGLETPLAEDDRLMIVPSIAGGLEQVDHAALRTNQAFIIALCLLAFVLNQPWLATFVASMMILGTILRVPAFGFIYRGILRPLGWIKPQLLKDNPEPHRFAQGFGAVALTVGVAVLLVGANWFGWGLIWLVIGLAALNLFAGFCVGCAVYYWLGRLKVPGFVHFPPDDTFPGMRPKAKA
jgi:molybdopterin converting factor small subunit